MILEALDIDEEFFKSPYGDLKSPPPGPAPLRRGPARSSPGEAGVKRAKRSDLTRRRKGLEKH